MAYTLTYSLINKGTEYEYEVTGYTGEPVDVVIPSDYNGLPVTSIGVGAFIACTSLASVEIPDSVTSIGSGAFYDCDSLTSVVVPDSVTTIGAEAFASCDSLTSVVIGDSVTSIGNWAFSYCSSLTSVVIGDSVTSIDSSAFASCDSLTSVVIGDSVTSIGVEAFYNCSSLTSVIIPDSVTTIGKYAFENCSRLTSITLLSKTPARLAASNSFDAISANAKFYCHSSALDTYKTATNWNTYASQFVADDLRLYFTMNSRAQKKYFASKEWVTANAGGSSTTAVEINIWGDSD